jgi:N-acetylglucosaminyl-diphospho-decaprenol L-rhamnosyltransferase
VPALIATYASEAGGSERLLLDVAKGLTDPPLIACPEGWLAEQSRDAGFVVFPLRARSVHLRASARDRVAAGLRLAGHARELRRLCEDLQPDLLVAWGMRTGLAAAAGMRGMKKPPPVIFEHVDFLPGPAIARAVRAAAAKADAVVCVSHALASDLDPDSRLGERIQVIHCGVDLARFTPAGDAARADAAAAARPDTSDAEALALGAIVHWKRPDLALETVAIAAKELPGLRLRIAGSALDGAGEELLARLRERASAPDLAGRVEFAGPLADPRAALREAACLLHCSDREPFGLVLVEALASGTPVVAAAAGGPAEIVDDSCGALYPPGDAQAAATALVDVLKRRTELAAPARRRAETAFAVDAMQARYDELFRTQTVTKGSDPYSRVTSVTVTFNSEPELRRLTASLDRHLPGARLIVVDNASSDGSAAAAREAGATVIELPDNRGFGAAANAGLAQVDEPVTILLNPDVELVDSSLAHLARSAEPGRLLAPLLLDGDGSREDNAQPVPATGATALYAVLPGAALPGRLRRFTEPWQSRTPRRVGWATAACLVARTETLNALGPFDESIFLYAEDLDLGLRAADAGVETWFHPEARVIHTRAHSTTRAFGGEAFELLAGRRRAVVAERLGRRRAIVDDVIQLVTFAERRFLKRLARRPADREAAQMRALLAARKRVP